MAYTEPKLYDKTLADLVAIARRLGINYFPITQEFLPVALAMMSQGEIKGVVPNPQYAPGDGIIIDLGFQSVR